MTVPFSLCLLVTLGSGLTPGHSEGRCNTVNLILKVGGLCYVPEADIWTTCSLSQTHSPPQSNTIPYVCFVTQISTPSSSVLGFHRLSTSPHQLVCLRGPEAERKTFYYTGTSSWALECLEKYGKSIWQLPAPKHLEKTEKHFGMCGIGSMLSFSTCNVLILNPCEQKLQLKQHREGWSLMFVQIKPDGCGKKSTRCVLYMDFLRIFLSLFTCFDFCSRRSLNWTTTWDGIQLAWQSYLLIQTKLMAQSQVKVGQHSPYNYKQNRWLPFNCVELFHILWPITTCGD